MKTDRRAVGGRRERTDFTIRHKREGVEGPAKS